MARNGPPDDFNNQPTQFADYGTSGRPPVGGPAPGDPPPAETPFEPPPEEESPQLVDPLEEPEPTPWYRKPAALAGWIAAVLVLLGLIVFGVMELIHGQPGTSRTPSTSTTTPSTSTTTTSTTPTTGTSVTTTPAPSSSAVEPPVQQPTQLPTRQPTQQPTHHHHLPQLPSTITIPGVPNPITLPPGLP